MFTSTPDMFSYSLGFNLYDALLDCINLFLFFLIGHGKLLVSGNSFAKCISKRAQQYSLTFTFLAATSLVHVNVDAAFYIALLDVDAIPRLIVSKNNCNLWLERESRMSKSLAGPTN